MNENFKFPHWCGEDCDGNDENGNECPYLNGDNFLLPNDDVEHGELVECLNELKMYRNSSYGELYDMAHKLGYNKALDDLLNAIPDCDHVGIEHLVCLAEQLRKGENNERNVF